MVTGRATRVAALGIVAVAVAACSHAGPPAASIGGAAPRLSQPAPTDQASGLAAFKSTRAVPQVAMPVRLRITRIGVDSGFERLGTALDGTVNVPSKPEDVGWFSGGARPGQAGPAVILGHVDSRRGPAVFYRLHELRSGDLVDVDRADGTTARFRIIRSGRYAKTRFPTADVYYPTLRPELRLITCGGTIDQRTGHYRDNLVVFAELA